MMSKTPTGKEEMSDAEIARLGLIAELDAINFYEQLAEIAKDQVLKKALLEIAYEEKEHVGEFLELLKLLDSEQIKAIKDGSEEIKEIEEKE